MMQKNPSEQGFALFIVAALFMAFSLIAVAMIDRSSATKSMNMVKQTDARMQRISEALVRYSLNNNLRYPCPASTSIAVSAATFGQAVAACQADPLAGGVTLLGVAPVVAIRGMVPVRELLPYGINPEDAFDAWGNRIMYVVDRQMTALGTGTSGGAVNRPAITDSYTSTTTFTFRDPDYLLISYGRDGVGAIPKNTTSVAIACNAGSAEARMQNCKDNLTFVMQPITTAPGSNSAQYFDDILRFAGQ